ncbi:MAG: PPC domain-containing DNA-binding protein [Candidatus Thalassarchaeaceae archaeon]
MNSSIGLSTPVLKAYEETGRSSIPLDFHWRGGPSLSRGLPSIAENSTKVQVEKLEGLDSGQIAMDHTRSGSDLFVRIDPGEEIHEALQRLADEVGFDAAAITSGIGRTRDNLYGFMDGDGVYQRRLLKTPSELVSLSGNIARKQSGEAFTHIHCCWSDDDNVVHAGHMFQSTVHVVAEVHIRVMEHAVMTRCPLEGVELLGLEFG